MSGDPQNASVRSLLRRALTDRYGLDLRALAAFRIGMGALLLLDLGLRARQLREFYAADGLTAPYLVATTRAHALPWPHFWSGAFGFQATLFVIAALFAGMLLVGWRTRLAAFASWVLLTSLHFRNPAILLFGDTIFRLLVFWCMFLPLAAHWALDRHGERAGAGADAPVLTVGALAVQLQLAFIYLFSALHKTGAPWREEGSAIYYALSVDYYSTALGEWLLGFPALLEWLTFAVWYVELLVPLLLFSPFFSRPVRLATALALVGVHAGFAATMRFGFFQLVPCVAMLLFVPPAVWDRWRRA